MSPPEGADAPDELTWITEAFGAERVVVGIDGSIASRAAVRWAVRHARPGDTVELVHVWSRSSAESGTGSEDDDAVAHHFAARELAHARVLSHDAAVGITISVVEGDARECLCEIPADVLVVGASARSIAGRLLGSVSGHLTRHAHCPLVIVPCPSGSRA